MKVIIVGGVAAGATTATRLRRLNAGAEIVLLEKGPDISYAGCGLPYYVGGEITDRQSLILYTPKGLNAHYGVDVRVENEALAIDTKNNTLRVRSATGEEYEERYDKLVLATGAAPVRPPLPGIELPGIFTLRNVRDADRIKSYMDAKKPKTAVVVGCGAIGLEMAEMLHKTGLGVTAVDMAAQVLPPLDEDMAGRVQQYLEEQGIRLALGQGVQGFAAREGGLEVRLAQQVLLCDMVVLAVGVRPDTALAKAAGLQLDAKGYIRVDRQMRTSDSNIYAAGDAVAVPNRVSGRAAAVPLAGPAARQARVVADNLAGIPTEYQGALGSFIIRLFGMTVAATGLSRAACEAAGLPCETAHVRAADHAGYMPGAQPIIVKAVYAPQTGVLLGAQLVGTQGVDKRADVLAAAVYARMTADDLAGLDLCYAPSYSTPRDVVNTLGSVMQKKLAGGPPAAEKEHGEELLREEYTHYTQAQPAEHDLGEA